MSQFICVSPDESVTNQRCQTFILDSRLRSGEVAVVDSFVDMYKAVFWSDVA